MPEFSTHRSLGVNLMPLVFVHGVNTRRGKTPEEQNVFDNRVKLLSEQFRHVVFAERVTAADGLAVFTPYWGDLGVTFARNLASLPQAAVQALAVGQPEAAPLLEAVSANLDAELLQQPGIGQAPLLTMARTRTLAAAVDMLFAGSANAPLPSMLFDTAQIEQTLPEVAHFAAAAERYAAANAHPAWLASVADDETFVSRLVDEIAASEAAERAGAADRTVGDRQDAIQALGFGDGLKAWLDNGVTAVRGGVNRVVDNTTGAVGGLATQGVREGYLWFSGYVRPFASEMVGRFAGDVFTYLDNRQPIIDRVLADIDNALAARRLGDDEVYLVGHSFGGIILYDILTHFRPDIPCHLYVTVGSQVALFAEMGRLVDKDRIAAAFNAGTAALVPRPLAAKRWINIFDPTDPFSFGTRGVYGGARDFQFETDALPIVSHSAYFSTPRFYARLKERVHEAFQHGTDS
jgi:hypothetical protein